MLKMRLAELQRQQDEQNLWQKQAYQTMLELLSSRANLAA